MRKKPKGIPAKSQPPKSAPSKRTRDERTREPVNAYVARYALTQPDEEYQYGLSKLLCNIECTDTGNAIRFAARFGHLCKFVPEPDKWFIWDQSGVWKEDTEGKHIQYAKKVGAYIQMEADVLPLPIDANGDPLMYPAGVDPLHLTGEQEQILAQFERYEDRKEALQKWAMNSRNNRALAAIIKWAKDEDGITVAKARFDADDMLLNCKNGIFNLRDWSFGPHDRRALMMRQANVSYDPDAQYPEWNKFLRKVTCERPNLVRFLAQITGMGLTGQRVEDLFIVFSGNGGNGKTVWQEMIREMLGTYVGVASLNLFMERQGDSSDFELAGLDGVRLLLKDETKQGRALDEAMMKMMTGGFPVTTSYKFKDNFTYTPKFTPILSTNWRPRIVGTDDGVWRRLREVPWEYKFANDPEKKPKEEVYAVLRQELSGILNWALTGFYDYTHFGVFDAPEILKATEDYKHLSDIIGQFLEDECYVDEVDEDGKPLDHKLPMKILFDAYKLWIEENGSHHMNRGNFNEQLKRRPIRWNKTGKLGYHWIGIRMRDKANDEPMQHAELDVEEQAEEVIAHVY